MGLFCITTFNCFRSSWDIFGKWKTTISDLALVYIRSPSEIGNVRKHYRLLRNFTGVKWIVFQKFVQESPEIMDLITMAKCNKSHYLRYGRGSLTCIKRRLRLLSFFTLKKSSPCIFAIVFSCTLLVKCLIMIRYIMKFL